MHIYQFPWIFDKIYSWNLDPSVRAMDEYQFDFDVGWISVIGSSVTSLGLGLSVGWPVTISWKGGKLHLNAPIGALVLKYI